MGVACSVGACAVELGVMTNCVHANAGRVSSLLLTLHSWLVHWGAKRQLETFLYADYCSIGTCVVDHGVVSDCVHASAGRVSSPLLTLHSWLVHWGAKRQLEASPYAGYCSICACGVDHRVVSDLAHAIAGRVSSPLQTLHSWLLHWGAKRQLEASLHAGCCSIGACVVEYRVVSDCPHANAGRVSSPLLTLHSWLVHLGAKRQLEASLQAQIAALTPRHRPSTGAAAADEAQPMEVDASAATAAADPQHLSRSGEQLADRSPHSQA